jgi:guanylate kinase
MTLNLRSKGLILILSSPSGGGKSSLCRKLLELDPNLKLSISATTRAARSSETEGIDYYFKTNEEFQSLINEDLLLEYANIYNNNYGTPRILVEDQLNKGHDILFDIDWQGARSIKRKMPIQTVSIFIMPPSLNVLKQRLISRGDDNNSVIETRMLQAADEISHYSEYDYLVVNDDFDAALAKIESILSAERNRVSRLDRLENYL